MRITSAFAMIIAAVLAAAGGAEAYRLVEDRAWNLPAAGDVRISVMSAHGQVEVIGWGREEVVISATVRIKAASKSNAWRIYEGIVFEIFEDPEFISVRADLPNIRKDSIRGEGNTKVSIDYVINVPMTADVDVQSVTGVISIAGMAGTVHVLCDSGSIEMLSGGGEGVLKTGNGDINCGLSGLPSGGMLFLRTGRGDVSLDIPGDTDALLTARTDNGRVRMGIGAAGFEEGGKREVKGILGAGDGNIFVESANGDVNIGEL